MAEQTPSGFIPASKETSDTIKEALKKRVKKNNPNLPVYDNVSRWESSIDKQFTPQEAPKVTRGSNSDDKVGKVKSYLIDKKKRSRTKPERLPSTMGFAGRHTPQNELKEFKNSGVPASQVMR